MKKSTVIGMGAAASALALALVGCSGATTDSPSSGTPGGGGNIEVFFNMTSGSPLVEATDDIVKRFEEETGAKVEAVYDQAGFEDAIKVRLASGDVPDVFATHGWSVMRYSEFLEPLNDRPWHEYVEPGLDSSMRDADGNLYALPLQYTVAGIGVNFDVLEEAGVAHDEIKTWDDFNAAAEKIKANGVSPIASSGKDGLAGNVVNFVASGAFTEAELTEFENGAFAEPRYREILEMIQGWSENGFFNPDYVSASTDDVARALAQGQAAFILDQPDLLGTALSFDENANIGFIPYPNFDGDRYLVGGEGIASFGVASSSKNKELAMEFLDFMAQPENAVLIANASGGFSGLTNVEGDAGALTSSYEEWVGDPSIPTLPFFDRAFLPSGMFDAMKATTDGVISGQNSVDDAMNQMTSQFESLYGQTQ